jgi:hypothetical protein
LKKITSILLLLLLLHNIVGYYVYLAWKNMNVDQEMSYLIENEEINEQDLLVFEVPIDFYFQGSRPSFQRAEGSFVFEGKVYEKVKQKLVNSTMYIYCYNNKKKEQLNTELSQHIEKNAIDPKGKSSDKNKKTSIDFIKDYLQPIYPIVFQSFIASLANQLSTYFYPFSNSLTLAAPTPPPDSV